VTTSPPRRVDAIERRFRALFEGHAAVFATLSDGARIGFVARRDFDAPPSRRRQALVQAAERASDAPMLAFEARGGAMTIAHEAFAGFERAGVDLLFVADDATLGELANADVDAFGVLKRALRRGGLMFYALSAKHRLQDAGYEDFLDALGLAFLGACR
jgi:hypothetical protein